MKQEKTSAAIYAQDEGKITIRILTQQTKGGAEQKQLKIISLHFPLFLCL